MPTFQANEDRYLDIERLIEFDFIRATEAAALNVLPWLGRGQKELADGAASDAVRGMFDLMNICAEVVIGEGIKDNAPGLFKGEQLGKWLPGTPKFDIAIDPIDGTTNLSKGMPGSLSVIAAASPEPGIDQALLDIPSFYMQKLAYGPQVKRYAEKMGIECLNLLSPIDENLEIVAKALRKRVQDVVVCVLDRPRHATLIEKIRSVGCALRMIGDGDIGGAIAPSLPNPEIDLYVGTGGSPEAVLAAAALRCLGGDIQAQMWPRDEAERASIEASGWKEPLERVYTAADLARGRNIMFCATAISDCPGLPGVRVSGEYAETHSILMRARSQTVRRIDTRHNLSTKTIRLRSSHSEHRL
ncbi:MAG TPA: class II fructose-bisphosphatase [Candidatus Methylacidiphilales bacterium]